jgi:hypothetical protein
MESIKSFQPSSFLENIVTTSSADIANENVDNGLGCECAIDVSLHLSFFAIVPMQSLDID